MTTPTQHSARLHENHHYYTRRALWHWRRATATHRALPNFLIICASRSGNSALYSYLTSHPQVIRAFKREVEYFSHFYPRGTDWYRAHFPLKIAQGALARLGKERKVISGESSPFYLPHPCAAERIATTLPDVQLIVLLRDPVARAYSHYMHERIRGHEDLSFADAVATEGQRVVGEMEHMQSDPGYHSIRYCRHAYVRLGEYVDQLKPYLMHFSRNRILVVKSEDLFTHPQTTLDRITEFLCLRKCAMDGFKKINSETYTPLDDKDPGLARKLADHYRPYNATLCDQLGVNFQW